MSKVFLGGTCNESKWREELIPSLEGAGIDYFNPVVDDWNDEAYKRELYEREHCDFCLYVITPRMTGVYAIAEVVDDSNKRPAKTIFIFLDFDRDDMGFPMQFSPHQIKALGKVGKMIAKNGGACCQSLEDVVKHIQSVEAFSD